MQPPVPGVEVADDADRARARRPDGERGPGHPADLGHVRAELLVELLVAPLAGEVEVDLADRRREGVGVAQAEAGAVGVVDLELVVEGQLDAGDEPLEEARVVDLLELHGLAAVVGGPDQDEDALGVGPEGADDGAALGGVRPEQAVRVAEVARDDAPDVLLDAHEIGSSSRRAMPATGMAAQSGRLSSSYWSSYTAFSSSKTVSSVRAAPDAGGRRLGSTLSKYPVRKRSRAASSQPSGACAPRCSEAAEAA